MTLHSGRQKSEAIEDPIEGEVIALPGERAAAPVVAMGSEAGVAALPEDRMIDLEGRAGRGLREQLDRAIASASAALRHQLTPETIAANDAIGVGEEIRLGAGAAPAALQAARKPLRMTPALYRRSLDAGDPGHRGGCPCTGTAVRSASDFRNRHAAGPAAADVDRAIGAAGDGSETRSCG